MIPSEKLLLVSRETGWPPQGVGKKKEKDLMKEIGALSLYVLV